MTTLVSTPPTTIKGTARLPGDKSVAHRALIIASLTAGVSRLTNLPDGEDVAATVRALRALGAEIEREGKAWRVNGRGAGGLRAPKEDLDFGNSGTTAALLLGVLAAHDLEAHCTGDASLRRRPLSRVLEPLRAMGARTMPEGAETLPFTFRGTAETVPVVWAQDAPSAQVKSAVLLAALNTLGATTVIEPAATRDHTERLLKLFGAKVTTTCHGRGREITLPGWQELRPQSVTVPGDFSSAAFLLVAAVIARKGAVTVKAVGVNPGRTGLLSALRKMGAKITLSNKRTVSGELVADIRVENAPLKAIRTKAAEVPAMIDEFPALFAAAACAKGRSVFAGLGALRRKESDRAKAMASGLRANGVSVIERGDGLVIEGCRGPAPGGGKSDAAMDHRVAMALLALGVAAEKPVAVSGAETIATSFPGFARVMNRLGAHIEEGA